ncbi:MAG: 50S ribosomal protein L21 [Saprospiraceae bacterium]|jgi:large subunit ribosomal protein L21|nr:50S ribosomal protein L21 [Saprospiraceae bacterium]MBP9208965.1 50S ribosomal protein L21 [Saprospiraceae bacterium]MBV6472798.1 50S ribosomal protein L21 [Saprospiraceae bacterium]
MIAVVNIAGQQFKCQTGQKLYVHRLENDRGVELNFDQVLMVFDGDSATVGTPTVAGASVTAKVMDHVKGDKVIVYKKKRRKGYEKKNGHRQQFTQIEITSVVA